MCEEKSTLNLDEFRHQQKSSFTHSPFSKTLNDCSPPIKTAKRKVIPILESDSDDSQNTIIMSDCEIIEILDNDDVEIVCNSNKPEVAKSPQKVVNAATPTFTTKGVDTSRLNNVIALSPYFNTSRAKKSEAVLEKEKQMRFLREKYPSMESMAIHDILSKHNFDIDGAIEDIESKLKDKDAKATIGNFNEWKVNLAQKESAKATEQVIRLPVINSATVISSMPIVINSLPVNEAVRKRNNIGEFSNATKKKAKRMRTEAVSDESDYEANDFKDNRVFNSDEDSDVEISNHLTKDKRKVLDFFQNGTPNELSLMQSCSKKKVEALIESRPFSNWTDLVEKLQNNKNLSTDLLNFANQVIITRKNIKVLMKKCNNLAVQLQRAVAAGGGVQQQPELLNPEMHLTGHQLVGLNWLAVLHEQGVNGILADEMGLGKTIQVIAFLAHLKETGASKGIPHLIVVPSSTLENWRVEFKTWCPDLNLFMYYGTTEERKMYRIEYFSKGLINDFDVILTTYSMVTNSSEERKMFRVTQMDYLVFDEAHMLKNMNTQRYENLMRIKAANRILLTGTPLQNNLLELMSLLIFVMPVMFAGKTEDIKSLFQKNSKAAKQASVEDLPKFERTQINQAKDIMKPFVLRRLKRDVLQDLPPKTEEVVFVPMAESQLDQYKNLVFHFKNNAQNPCEEGPYSPMTVMSDLRKLSNHPLLLKYFYQYEDLTEMATILAADPTHKETVVKYLNDDLACMSDYEIHTLCKQYPSISRYQLPDNLIVNSGKFAYLDEKLEEFKQGQHRILIFSQYVIMLNVMEAYLQIRNHSYLRLDGSTPVITRQELIDQFTADPSIFIFLLSTKAGGLGINLTAADTVIIHDIDFNPYNDKQAEDRCHRIGQTKTVRVIRLVSSCSIEQGMWHMNQQKLKLEREVTADESESTDSKGVINLLASVFKMDNDLMANEVSTPPIVIV